MKRKTTLIFIIASITVAILTGLGDLAGKSFICESSACVKIHSSSFGTAFFLPIGFYAAGFLGIALWLYWKGKTDYAGIFLCGLLGVDAYFTFIQVIFIRSFCFTCLIFFCLLIACVISLQAAKNWNALITGSMLFLLAHFCFFFPDINLRPTLIQDAEQINTQVEIFASPTCSHCEQAIAVLRGVCEKANTQLIVRPVSISKADAKKSVEWVSGKLFSCKSPTSNRLAEKIVWDNEAEAKQLNNGLLSVPLILIKSGGDEELFKGWNDQIQQAVYRHLGMKPPEILVKNILTVNKKIMCTKTSSCDQ